jgi:hypothetical protein
MGRRTYAGWCSKSCAPTTPCLNRSHNVEPQNMELVARLGSREDRGFTVNPNAEASAESVARVDVMFLDRMRQIHIGPSLIYPAVGAVPNITIDYTVTSDSYSTFVTAHFPPQQYDRKLVQETEARESALHILSWKEQGNTREQLELKAQSGSIEDWKAYVRWEKTGKKGTVRALACAVRACY